MTSTVSPHKKEIISLTIEQINLNSPKGRFSQTLKDGFFYLEIPQKLREQMTAVTEFGQGIRENASLREHALGAHLGYQENPHSLSVSFRAMSKQWDDVYPENVKNVAEAMNNISKEILKATFTELNIPKQYWALVTAGLISSEEEVDSEHIHSDGSIFTFNHYKTKAQDEQTLGMVPHKDIGWIANLHMTQIGLETSEDGLHWESIAPKDGYFIINFGSALTALVPSKEVTISLHRVRNIDERVTFASFLNAVPGATIYSFDGQSNPQPVKTYGEYINDCIAEILSFQSN